MGGSRGVKKEEITEGEVPGVNGEESVVYLLFGEGPRNCITISDICSAEFTPCSKVILRITGGRLLKRILYYIVRPMPMAVTSARRSCSFMTLSMP